MIAYNPTLVGFFVCGMLGIFQLTMKNTILFDTVIFG